MTQLYNDQWTRQQIQGHVGDISQIGGVHTFTLADGPERGVRAAELRSAAGLRFTVYLDRGMDIGPAEYKGIQLRPLSMSLRAPAGCAASTVGC